MQERPAISRRTRRPERILDLSEVLALESVSFRRDEAVAEVALIAVEQLGIALCP